MPARISSAGTASWLLPDRMGSIRNVVDTSGAVINALTYDAFGNVVSESSPTNGGEYKYDGYRFDVESGLFRPDPSVACYYDPATGRWRSEDPIGFGGGDANLWRYVGNQVINSSNVCIIILHAAIRANPQRISSQFP